MSYRVVIPTAGTGSRLGDLTKYINKSLVSISHRPAISHLIEQFPDDCEFVIALGYKGQLVKDYLELAYPKRQFFFVNVLPFEGEGSGLGASLLACEKHLQQPFVFISCDTLVKGQIRPPDHNWMGYADLEDISHYRTLQVENGYVDEIQEKGILKENAYAYIGLSGIYDYQQFWKIMHNGADLAINQGESFGLREIVRSTDVTAYNFTWFDTGVPKALQAAQDAYQQPDEPNILEKSNEAIWFVDGNVIKYSDDKEFIANRVARVDELKGFVPEVYACRENMYCYYKVEGSVLSDVITIPLFDQLMSHSQSFWTKHDLDNESVLCFQDTCLKFYRDKTIERINLFYDNFNKKDGAESINGEEQSLLEELLSTIDWGWISKGCAGRFHGDFHFENILWSEVKNEFVFLDWRQDFGGDLTTGDIYYDLAKLMHGLIVSHELIAQNQYEVVWKENEIRFDLHRKQKLVECEQRLNQWIQSNGYDLKKVRVLTALIFLNIAALHHYPYSLLLYALGKSMLKKEL